MANTNVLTNTTTYAFFRGIKITTYSNNFPYNSIVNERLNSNEETIENVLNTSKIFKGTATSSGSFSLMNKCEQNLENVIDYVNKFDTKKKDFYFVINDINIKTRINDCIENKQDFEVIFIKLGKDIKRVDYAIKSKYIYFKLEWKLRRQCGIFKKRKAVLTISSLSKGHLILH